MGAICCDFYDDSGSFVHSKYACGQYQPNLESTSKNNIQNNINVLTQYAGGQWQQCWHF